MRNKVQEGSRSRMSSGKVERLLTGLSFYVADDYSQLLGAEDWWGGVSAGSLLWKVSLHCNETIVETLTIEMCLYMDDHVTSLNSIVYPQSSVLLFSNNRYYRKY